jgi:hypothetical protein
MLDSILNGLFYLAKWSLLALGLVVLASACFGFYCGIKAATRGRDYADSDEEATLDAAAEQEL